MHEHDTTTDIQFDREEWAERLQPGSDNGPEGRGYVAIVRDLGPPRARLRRPVNLFHSEWEHGPSGVFAKHLDAVAYAERWTEAKIAQEERIHTLRVRRGLGLGVKLRELALERGRLEAEAKKVSRAKKDVEERQNTLVREANEPEVEIHIGPSMDSWAIYDVPCVTDGTQEHDHRQLVLEHTGLEPIVPVEKGPRKPPRRATRKGKTSVGEADAPAESPPGLDPSAVVWPEDEAPSETDPETEGGES